MTSDGRRFPDTVPPPEQVLFQDEDLLAGHVTRLTGSEADHARRSLRLHRGDPIHLVNGHGIRCRGRIMDVGKQFVDIAVEAGEILPVWPRRTIRLGAGVLRSSRMDFLVEKASELGVSSLTPLVLERSVARPGAEGAKEDRWHRLAVESLKQCRRAFLMELAEPLGLEAFLAARPEGDTLWMADPAGEDPSWAASRTGPGTLTLVVGPEGGLSPRERDLLLGGGGLAVRLGGHRLRAETAAATLITAALTLLGELGEEAEG